jgi:hypothetical protein
MRLNKIITTDFILGVKQIVETAQKKAFSELVIWRTLFAKLHSLKLNILMRK